MSLPDHGELLGDHGLVKMAESNEAVNEIMRSQCEQLIELLVDNIKNGER